MRSDEPDPAPGRWRRRGTAVVLILAAVLVGAVLMAALTTSTPVDQSMPGMDMSSGKGTPQPDATP